jgi:hypothetical protein
MAFLESIGFEFREYGVGFLEGFKDVLNVFESGILAHSIWYLFGGCQKRIEPLTKFAELSYGPCDVLEIWNLVPDSAESGPYSFEIA